MGNERKGFLSRLGGFFSRIPDVIRPTAICTVCGVDAPVCCLAEGVPPRCDLHCNHLDNGGRSLR